MKEWAVALLSTGVGAAITVGATWALTAIKEASERRKESQTHLRKWWKDLRAAVHRFDLLWTAWVACRRPSIEEAKPWHHDFFENLLTLRSSLEPCQVRARVDQATRQLSQLQHLEILTFGDAAEKYELFILKTQAVLDDLKELADTVPG